MGWPSAAEQVRAVVCFDNRVQVIAAAGSGKTSTMVARAAYAVQHGLGDPERILMLRSTRRPRGSWRTGSGAVWAPAGNRSRPG